MMISCIQHQRITTMLPCYNAGILQSNAGRTFTNQQVYNTAQVGTVFIVRPT